MMRMMTYAEIAKNLTIEQKVEMLRALDRIADCHATDRPGQIGYMSKADMIDLAGVASRSMRNMTPAA